MRKRIEELYRQLNDVKADLAKLIEKVEALKTNIKKEVDLCANKTEEEQMDEQKERMMSELIINVLKMGK